ncbi:MAG: exodeoxyribonuclease VII large subunit [Planctomycetales bacterium]
MSAHAGPAAGLPVLSVADVTRRIKECVEGNFPCICVRGEISNFTRAGSGHVYLTLKDEQAQLRAVMWRSRAARVPFQLHDGLAVLAVGAVEVYAARGSYQLMIEELIPEGLGALELAFRQLQQKLAAEGLFDPERKRPLPRFPRRIALVTSPTGAAVRDLLQVITRRWPAADVVIVPVPVQGDGAAARIAAALGMVHRIPGVEVVVTGRGGGSLEDLWAFNEEVVARAIHACRIPVVSAVGHEIDVSIADLVADRRALTPSEAGELVVPHRQEVLAELGHVRERLCAALRERAARARMRLDALAGRRVFTHPLQRVRELALCLDDLAARSKRCIRRRIENARRELGTTTASLDALSPLRVLGRGYSITRRATDRGVVRAADELRPGEEIETLFQSGKATSRVERVEPDALSFGQVRFGDARNPDRSG